MNFVATTKSFSTDVYSKNVEFVNVTYGACFFVAVDGNKAYISAGVYLWILDITDKSAPILLGSIRLPGVVRSITISGSYAYIANYDSGLRIVDISNPQNPEEVGAYDTPGQAWDVFVSGGDANPNGLSSSEAKEQLRLTAYIADGFSGLRIVDVSNPRNPVEVGFLDTPGFAWCVHISDNYSYIADGFSGLRVIDVSNPESPVEVGYYDTPKSAEYLVALGDYAYIADNDSGLHIIDISNPQNPEEVGAYDTPGQAWGIGVAISGDYANPNGRLRLTAKNNVPSIGITAYIADDFSGLRIIDVSNPENPIELGFYDTPGNAEAVATSGDYAYIADSDHGLRIIDVSNPQNPEEVGFYDTPGRVYGVAPSGGYAYIADYSSLRVVDVSNPENLYEVKFYETPGYTENVTVLGDYAYIADWASGLRVIDISNPENPYEVGFSSTPGFSWGVTLSGDYANPNVSSIGITAYIANDFSGLRIVDVSNPKNPEEVGFYDTPGFTWDVAVSGDYAYLADDFNGLRIVDVSNPKNPEEVGFYYPPGNAMSVAVSSGYAYITDYSSLSVVDVSNPKNPYEVGFYDTPGEAWRVAIVNDQIYVADGDGGMSILHFTAAELSVGSISPPIGSTVGGTEVMIYGTNFKEGATVTIGGNDAINPVVDATTAMFIKATIPPRFIGVGLADVVITNPGGESATLEGGLKYIAPDVNSDGRVDILDLALVRIHFGETVIDMKTPNPDVNGDGKVDISDLALIGIHFGD